MLAEQTGIAGAEHLSLQQDGIISGRGFEQMPTGEKFAGSNLNLKINAPLLQRWGEGLDAETERRLLEIIGNDQNAAHGLGLSRR